jgi:putative transposase
MTRLRHFDGLGTVRFVTISCLNRMRLLGNDDTVPIVLGQLNVSRQKHQYRILAYVVMPNHMHLVLWPRDRMHLGRVMGEFKALTTREILSMWKKDGNPDVSHLIVNRGGKTHKTLWIPRCFDHNCRSIETVREKINYCHSNPVKAGLVGSPGEWRWSSYGWYRGDKRGLVPVDIVEL